MIENPDVSPGERLLVLKEAADEARAYKMGGEDKIRVAVNTCDMVRSLGHPLLQPINAFLQLASHTEYIESILRSLTSLSALAPYVRESRAQYKHLSDISGFPNHGESLAGPSAVNPPVDMASASASYPFAPFPDVSSSRARVERESQSAVRAGKKRKVPPHSVSSQSSTRSSSETQRNNASNPHPKRREIASRHHNHEETDQGESSDEQSELFVTGNNADRLARTHHRARTRGTALPMEPVAPSKTTSGSATWSGRRVVDASVPMDHASQGDAPRTTSRSRISKASSAGSNRDDADDQRYCFCNNVSYGDMIGCDDDDCEREWFHLGCVGLSKPPQGTWYCDACLERRMQQSKNKTKRSARPTRAPTSGVPPATSDVPTSARRVASHRR